MENFNNQAIADILAMDKEDAKFAFICMVDTIEKASGIRNVYVSPALDDDNVICRVYVNGGFRDEYRFDNFTERNWYILKNGKKVSVYNLAEKYYAKEQEVADELPPEPFLDPEAEWDARELLHVVPNIRLVEDGCDNVISFADYVAENYG